MILKELEKIAADGKQMGQRQDYIRNLLKEYLQVYVLSFVYTSAKYSKELIFTGGTALRHFYNLDRLSEYVDFDYVGKFDAKTLCNDVLSFFQKKYKYKDASVSLKQDGRQVLLKFPVLKHLGMPYLDGSDLLYVKMDISALPSKNYSAIISSQSKFGFNYVARHYDLPDLMAGKIHAILSRRMLKGHENRESIKGRDYFDLLWFLKNKVSPNIARLQDMLGRKISLSEMQLELDEKVRNLGKFISDYISDIEPLVKNPETIKTFIKNYPDEYARHRLVKL